MKRFLNLCATTLIVLGTPGCQPDKQALPATPSTPVEASGIAQGKPTAVTAAECERKPPPIACIINGESKAPIRDSALERAVVTPKKVELEQLETKRAAQASSDKRSK